MRGQQRLYLCIRVDERDQIDDVIFQSAEIGADIAHRIVDFMCAASRELTDRRHLFRLHELGMRLFAALIHGRHFGVHYLERRDLLLLGGLQSGGGRGGGGGGGGGGAAGGGGGA